MTRYDDTYDINGAMVYINRDADAEYLESVNTRLNNAPAMECDEKEWWRLATMFDPPLRDPQAREFAERWARLMQLEVSAGKSIAEVYEDTSREAALIYTTRGDVNRAVYFLERCWVHGKELNRLYWYPGLTVDPKKLRDGWFAYWIALKIRNQADVNAHVPAEDAIWDDYTTPEMATEYARTYDEANKVYEAALGALREFYSSVDPDRGLVILNEFLEAKIQRDWADANFNHQVSLTKPSYLLKSWDDWVNGVASWAAKAAVSRQRLEDAQDEIDKLTMSVRVTE